MRLGLASALLGLTACGGDGRWDVVVGLRIVEPSADVQGGASATSTQLTLLADLDDGSSVVASAVAAWTSDDPATASVLAGDVTGVLAGRTTIRADYAGLQASVPAAVTCVPRATPLAVKVNDTGTSLAIASNGTVNSPNTVRCIGIDTLGRIHVAWFDPADGVRYARSRDGGASFEPSVRLVDLVDAPAPKPYLACGQAGEDDVYVAYDDAPGAVRCLRSADGGTTWPATGVLTGLPGNSRYGFGVRGTTVMIFTVNGVSMARSTNAGQTWAPPVPAVFASATFTDVVMDPRNSNVLAIMDDPLVRFRTSGNDGASFAAEVTVGAPALNYSDFGIDRLGHIFCAGSPPDWAVFDVDAQTYTQVASVLPLSGSGDRSLAVDGANAVHLVRMSADAVLLQSSGDMGATVSAEVTLDTASADAECAASLSHPGVGVIYIRAGNVMYQHN